MKLPFKYIAILVIVSLAGIFAYQAYWLTGLYHTMHSEMERDITEAMRMSDYNEMMIRVDKMKQDDINHGEVSVSAGNSDAQRRQCLRDPPERFNPRGSQCQEERSFAHQRGQCAFHRPVQGNG